MKRILKLSLSALPWLILVAIASYLYFFDGWRDLTTGRLHRTAYKMFEDTGTVDEVRIYLLQGEEGTESGQTFPIRPYGRNTEVYGVVTLDEEKIKEFIELWRWMILDLSYENQALCHSPPYGFQLVADGEIVVETSICWACSNFYVSLLGTSAWYGFIPEGSNASSLLNFCNSIMPYPKKNYNQSGDGQ
jgi:hypothetical protein